MNLMNELMKGELISRSQKVMPKRMKKTRTVSHSRSSFFVDCVALLVMQQAEEEAITCTARQGAKRRHC